MKILDIKYDTENNGNMEIEIEIGGKVKTIKLTEEEAKTMFNSIQWEFIKKLS